MSGKPRGDVVMQQSSAVATVASKIPKSKFRTTNAYCFHMRNARNLTFNRSSVTSKCP